MNEADIRLTERYLAEQLEGKEKNEFELRLQNEPELAEEYSTQLAVHLGRHLELKEEITQFMRDAGQGDAVILDGRRFWIYGSVAAACIMLLIGFFLFRPDRPQDIFDRYMSFPENPYASLGAEEDLLQQAFSLYGSGEYSKSIEVFDQVDMDNLSNNQQDELLFFKALSHLALRQTDAAIPSLNTLANKSGSQLDADARYYLGMAHLLAGDAETALFHFRQVRQDDLDRDLLNRLQTLIEELER